MAQGLALRDCLNRQKRCVRMGGAGTFWCMTHFRWGFFHAASQAVACAGAHSSQVRCLGPKGWAWRYPEPVAQEAESSTKKDGHDAQAGQAAIGGCLWRQIGRDAS